MMVRTDKTSSEQHVEHHANTSVDNYPSKPWAFESLVHSRESYPILPTTRRFQDKIARFTRQDQSSRDKATTIRRLSA
ncbi:hypothetical protein ABKN59_011037 [Abortiporus biennis]